jgi:hypothetical protein
MQIRLVVWKRWSRHERAAELQRLLKERRALEEAIKEVGHDTR